MIGKPRAFTHTLIFIVVLGIAMLIGSRVLDSAIGILGIGLLLAGSVSALWKSRKEPSNSQTRMFPSQISALPKKWQKWVLGEDDAGK